MFKANIIGQLFITVVLTTTNENCVVKQVYKWQNYTTYNYSTMFKIKSPSHHADFGPFPGHPRKAIRGPFILRGIPGAQMLHHLL